MTAAGRWLWALLALAAGALWASCFGRVGLLVAPWLALVPLLLLIGRGRPATTGFLFGLGFWLTAVAWIRPTLAVYGDLSPPLAWLALLAAACYLALYTAVFGLVAARARGGDRRLAAITVPAAWVALEAARGGGPLAFPWNLAGYALVEVPGALPLTSWIGAWGLSFIVVAVNQALAQAVENRDWRPAAAAVGLVAATLGAGALASSENDTGLGGGGTARLLQPNSAVTNVYDARQAQADYARLLAQSHAACAEGPALLIWPEGAAWPFSYQRHVQLRRDVQALAARGCAVILNSAVREGEATYNSLHLVSAERPDQRYDKEILVPFGETIPFGRWLSGLRTIARTVGDFTPGRGDTLLAWGEQRLAPAICFEIVFPLKAARQTRRGASALVTVTNDGWYGDSTAPWQHFRAARFRAAENRRPLLRAAITGVSGVIGANGSVAQMLGVGERGELAAAVAGRSDLTFFSRFPWLVPALSWALIPFAIFRRSERREET